MLSEENDLKKKFDAMKLQVENIGKINDAEIKIDGITVIAGPNNTGKSTIGKILFCLFDTLSGAKVKIREQRITHVAQAASHLLYQVYTLSLSSAVKRWLRDYSETLTRALIDAYEENQNVYSKEKAIEIFENVVKSSDIGKTLTFDKDDINDFAESVVYALSLTDEHILKEIVNEVYNDTFTNQVNSLERPDESAHVNAWIKGSQIHVSFAKNECDNVECGLELKNKVIYIDNPSILSKLSFRSLRRSRGHFYFNAANSMENRLLELLTESPSDDGEVRRDLVEKSYQKEKLEKVHNLINSAISATILESEDGYKLKEQGANYGVSFNNLSYGIWAFIILKMLIEKNSIQKKDVLFLDEPEIHLHPTWQIIFAHLVVLLQKEFDLSVVITTHSHFFVDAIDLYTRKYKSRDTTHFYLSSVNDRKASFANVSNDLIQIYRKMSDAVNVLEELREELDAIEED